MTGMLPWLTPAVLGVVGYLLVAHALRPLLALVRLKHLKAMVERAAESGTIREEGWKFPSLPWEDRASGAPTPSNGWRHGLKCADARFMQRRIAWWAARTADARKSMESLGDVFRPEDFYSPRRVDAAPGIMAGLGILGTFSGLAAGVANLKVAGSPDAMMAGIQRLLGGLSAAAWTSVIGIGGGVLFVLASRATVPRIEACCDRLNAILNDAFPSYAPGEVVKDLRDAQEATRAAVESIKADFITELADVLADRMTEGQERFQRQVASGLSEGILAGIRETLETFDQRLTDVRETLVPLAEQSARLTADVTRAIERQQPVLETLDRVVPTITEASESLARITSTLDGVAGRLEAVSSRSEAAAARMEKQEVAARKHVEQVAESLQSLSVLRDAVDQMAERLRSMLDQMARSTDERLRLTFEAFDKEMGRIAGRLGGVADEVADAFDRLPGLITQAAAAATSNLGEKAPGAPAPGRTGPIPLTRPAGGKKP